jgi:hypothetical protein
MRFASPLIKVAVWLAITLAGAAAAALFLDGPAGGSIKAVIDVVAKLPGLARLGQVSSAAWLAGFGGGLGSAVGIMAINLAGRRGEPAPPAPPEQ